MATLMHATLNIGGWGLCLVRMGNVCEKGSDLRFKLSLLRLELVVKLGGEVSHLLVKVFMAGSEVMLESLEICRVLFMGCLDRVLNVLDFLLKGRYILMDYLGEFCAEGGEYLLFEIGDRCGGSAGLYRFGAVVGCGANLVSIVGFLLFGLDCGVLGFEIGLYGSTVGDID